MSRKQWNHGRFTGYREGFRAGQRAGVLSVFKTGVVLALAVLNSRSGRRAG